jgi:hypothetical protein
MQALAFQLLNDRQSVFGEIHLQRGGPSSTPRCLYPETAQPHRVATGLRMGGFAGSRRELCYGGNPSPHGTAQESCPAGGLESVSLTFFSVSSARAGVDRLLFFPRFFPSLDPLFWRRLSFPFHHGWACSVVFLTLALPSLLLADLGLYWIRFHLWSRSLPGQPRQHPIWYLLPPA